MPEGGCALRALQFLNHPALIHAESGLSAEAFGAGGSAAKSEVRANQSGNGYRCSIASSPCLQVRFQTFHLFQKTHDKPETGIVHLAIGAKMLNAPESAQSCVVETLGARFVIRDQRDQTLFTVVQNRL